MAYRYLLRFADRISSWEALSRFPLPSSKYGYSSLEDSDARYSPMRISGTSSTGMPSRDDSPFTRRPKSHD